MKVGRTLTASSRGLLAVAAGAGMLWTLALFSVSASQAPAPASGLMVTYRQAGSSVTVDVLAAPRAALYVAEGQAATPFVTPGPYIAEFDGFVSVNLRDDYQFRAETNGSVEIRVGANVALSASAEDGETPSSKPVRLNRGPNALRVTYTSGKRGDSYLRVFWSSPEIAWEPVPASALTRAAAAAPLRAAQLVRDGRALTAEYRCLKCHRPSPATVPELQIDAPALTAIGARLNGPWMAQWVENPSALRPSARMPRVLHGAEAPAEARDIAAFLSSLGTPAPTPSAAPSADEVASGEQSFQVLRCASCHVTTGTPQAGQISLAGVRAKFAPGALARFLKQPNQHFAWIRMPDFGLADAEANALAAWLNTLGGAARPASEQAAADVARGKSLVQTRGCLSCHTLDLTNEYKARDLAELPASAWASSWHDPNSRSARYNLTANERAAFRAFAATDRRSLERHAPADFAASAVETLNCRGCHGQIERVPSLDLVGGKLRPEWAKALIDGTLRYKPRPWMEARMPAFPTYAGPLVAGLAAHHGLAATSPPDSSPIDEEMAEAGRRMVTAGGCANCHHVANFVGAQVPTTAGINLAMTADRLRYPYYTRWLLNPSRIWPETVMTKYFDGTRGPFDFYDHDAMRQIRALWEYMRKRGAMAPPQ